MRGWFKLCLGYVDDMALVAAAGTFSAAHRMLGSMLTREGGAYSWARSHNSRFEMTKSIIVNFSCNKNIVWPPMSTQGTVIAAKQAHKFLGVMMDQELRWGQQADSMLAKATKWLLVHRRLARPRSGANLKAMHQLYCAVAILKMTYVIEVWYTPICMKDGER